MKYYALIFGSFILLFSCRPDEPSEPEEFGYLTLGISVSIESEPASARVSAVDTDNFKVTIFKADGTEYLVIDPYASVPSEIQLPTGEYYVEAHSNDLVEAAFESPYYFSRSANFTIDKEELTTIDVEAKLANCKVAINFSPDVVNTFNSYSGKVTIVSSGTELDYAQGETREGYFVVEPLAVAVYLSYTKLDGSTIDRTFNTSIDSPSPATLYNINVDASLEDGAIVFNLTVDESVDTVNIDLEDQDFATYGAMMVDDSTYQIPTAYFGCFFDELRSFYDCQIVFSDGDPDLCSGTNLASIAGIGSDVALDQLNQQSFLFTTENGGEANAPQTTGVYVWNLIVLDIPGYDIDCEAIPGYTLFDTDNNGTTQGMITFQKIGTDYDISFSYSFSEGPDVSGTYHGPLININN